MPGFLQGDTQFIFILNVYITRVRSVVDPDPNWIRFQHLCGSGSVFRIRIHTMKNRGEKVEMTCFFKIIVYFLLFYLYFVIRFDPDPNTM